MRQVTSPAGASAPKPYLSESIIKTIVRASVTVALAMLAYMASKHVKLDYKSVVKNGVQTIQCSFEYKK
jgi:hypothetical protein